MTRPPYMKRLWRQRVWLYRTRHRIAGHRWEDISIDGLARHWCCAVCSRLEWRGEPL